MKIENKKHVPRENGSGSGGKVRKTNSPSPSRVSGEKAVRSGQAIDDLGNLIGKLKKLLSLSKGFAGREIRGAPALISLLSLLESAEPVPGSGDLKLAERFVSLWIEQHGAELPAGTAKGLSELESVLRNLNWSEEPFYIVTDPENNSDDRHWRMTVGRKESDVPDMVEDKEAFSCRIDFSSPRLGDVSVILQDGAVKRSCAFVSADERVRALLKKSIRSLRAQLERHGMEVPRISVITDQARKKNIAGENRKRGIDLWG
ncbi:flagellar hook-length control protein FliK [Spirochaeta isovalerica]|uniref:Flagellar hook-length control protein-like C-terminal domain-containing protein n=1 Tax=Spirochaeta isovalerica TaxID=150 RepID=A0A841RCS9_9SPIO|nr:flagellar hook-length control protein FliK [Spirochaeta isovalerica]MBB6481753.1 hypothetical protein [Spirochaeta isovalerica]